MEGSSLSEKPIPKPRFSKTSTANCSSSLTPTSSPSASLTSVTCQSDKESICSIESTRVESRTSDASIDCTASESLIKRPSDCNNNQLAPIPCDSRLSFSDKRQSAFSGDNDKLSPLLRSRKLDKPTNSNRKSDLIWFTSGIPPEFSNIKFDKENYAIVDELIAKPIDKPIPKPLYPDLSELYSEKIADDCNEARLELKFNDKDSKESTPTDDDSPTEAESVAIGADNRAEDNKTFSEDKIDESPCRITESKKIETRDDLQSSDRHLPAIFQQTKKIPVSVPHCTPSQPSASNVCYVGWLTLLKHNNLRKSEFIRRWCKLGNGKMTFYADEMDEKYLDTVDCENIQLVNSKSSANNEPLFSFDIYRNVQHNKLEQLTVMADSEQERIVWITFLARCLVAGEASDMCQNVDRVGRVTLKKGTTAQWESGWLLMINRTLLYSCENDGCTFEIDIRKVIRLRPVEDLVEQSRSSKHVSNAPHDFVIATEGSSLYIQTKYPAVTEAWKNSINFVLTQKTSVLCDQRLTFDDVPILIEKCTNFIAIHGINVEGIHRLSGTASKVRTLFDDIQRDPHSVHLLLEEYNVHDVSSVLRKFLRQLREPLITNDLKPRFIDTACISEAGSRRLACKALLRQLPLVNYRTMRRILAHLKCVTDNAHTNMMSVQNLAAIFGPTLFTVDRDALEGSDFTSTTQAIVLTADMILHYNWLFDVEEAELRKESLIQQVTNDLAQNHQKKKKLAGELLLSIYTDHRDGACFNMQISKSLTANDVCDFAAEWDKTGGLKRDGIALFEVVCKGELERIMSPEENVLEVISRWTTWPLEERANNFLIVKADYVTNRVKDMAFGLTLYPVCEVMFSDGKSFRRSAFKYVAGIIVQLKDAKSTKGLNEWNGDDLLWYFGCEAKRQPPTKHCLTFITKSDQIKRSKTTQFFGKSISFKDDKLLYKWLCTVLLINVNIPF